MFAWAGLWAAAALSGAGPNGPRARFEPLAILNRPAERKRVAIIQHLFRKRSRLMRVNAGKIASLAKFVNHSSQMIPFGPI